jgi:preprotein translocase subunit SecG
MNVIYYLVVTVHVIVCLFLVIVVLLQSGKGSDIAAAFSGQGSQTAFGPRGAATALSRATTWSAIIFMVTSISLGVMALKQGPKSVLGDLPASSSAPAAPKK